MSQKTQLDGGQKHFAVGQGLLAAAETLNYSMNDQRSNRQMGGMASGVGVGGGGAGMEGHDGSSQMSRHGSGNHLGNTMKLFASLGLSPSDLDALAEIPEEDISVETLPHIIRQLKNRKGETGDRRAASSMSSEATYQGGRDSWDEAPMGRMGGPSMGQGSARAQSSGDFGYSSMQDSSRRSYGLNYNSDGGGSRERPYSELSHHGSYSGLGLGPSSSDSIFMPRRVGPPPHRKVQDFLGVRPPVFPHLCSLCDFEVHSIMDWKQHTDGLRHAENRRVLLNMYPEWDPSMPLGRGGGLLDTPNLSAGLLGPAPMSSAQNSSWGGGADPGLSGKNLPGQNKLRSRVVVVKYDRKPLSTKTLFAFAEPFGVLRENLVLKNKAFFEMNSHEEALDMVNYYELHPASLYGKPLTFYLSKRLMVIEKDDRVSDRSMDRPPREVKGYGSQVVFFSNLPREEEKKMELLTIAARFGIVEKHLFLTDQAFVQLGTPEDAEMLVKYYSLNPLTIKGRPIRLNICTKYKTLNVNKRQGGSSGDSRGQRSSRGSTYSSSASGSRTSSSSFRTSSSSKSSSSSRSRDEKKKEEEESKAKPEEKPAVEEEEEEVSGVMEGEEEVGEVEQVADGDVEEEEEEEPETTETEEEKGAETEGVKEEEAPVGDDVTNDKPEDVGGAEAETEQGAESDAQTAEATETEEPERKEEPGAEPGESSETMDESADTLDQDFLENMEDFVTLDELAEDEDEDHEESDTIDNTRKGGMRVVNVVGLRRGYTFMEELLGLAKPFGKLVKHLVLDLKPEAYLQFETEEEARAMVKFYNSNVTASVCGRPVRISHSMTYPTIQCGSSKVVYIGQIPNSKYSDEALLKLAEPFGRVKKYFLNRIKRECFIEMDKAEQAEKMAEEYKTKAPKFNGKRLTVYVSRKYRQLKYGHHCPGTVRRESSITRSPKSSRHSEEPPAKKSREETQEEEKKEEQVEERKEEETQSSEVEDKREENSAEKIPEDSDQNQKISSDESKQDEEISTNQNGEAEAPLQSSASLSLPPQTLDVTQEEMETSTNQNGQTEAAPPPPTKTSVASLPLPPHDPDTPIGVEHVKMGYYCRVCFLFYSNEDMAKKTHCSSQAHYDKLQKHLEKEQSKAEKKKGKKTTP